MKSKSSQTTRGNEKKKPPPFFLLSLPLISLVHLRGESATRVESEARSDAGERDALQRNTTRPDQGGRVKKSSERELIQPIMATDRRRESRPDFTARYAEIDGFLCNRKHLCVHVLKGLFVEFVHVKQLPTV